MEIKPYGYQSYQKTLTQKNPEGKKLHSAMSAKKTDTVELSVRATAQTDSKAAAAVTKDVNQAQSGARIAALRQAVDEGSYRVDSARLAQSIINGRLA